LSELLWLGCHIISVCRRLCRQTSASWYQWSQRHSTSMITTVSAH